MSSMNDLRRIARQAMLDRGFLPDFSAAALQQSTVKLLGVNVERGFIDFAAARS